MQPTCTNKTCTGICCFIVVLAILSQSMLRNQEFNYRQDELAMRIQLVLYKWSSNRYTLYHQQIIIIQPLNIIR